MPEGVGPPAPGASDGAARVRAGLRERWRARSEPDGFLPFDRFMEIALYAEGLGYYARTRSPFGPDGDYYTAPRLTPLFARSLARYLAARLRAWGAPEGLHVVELGAGDGTLAELLLGEWSGPDRPFAGAEYWLLDRSETMRSRASAKASSAAAQAGIRLRTASELGELPVVRGAVLAHELFDALPLRRWERAREGWVELGARLDDRDVLVPARRATTTDPGPHGTARDGAELGEIREAAPLAAGLVRSVADRLGAGLFLIVDYGMERDELYRGHRHGTVSAVRAHHGEPDLLHDAGFSDLSAFVDFTTVREAAAASGLRLTRDERQAEALGRWGLPRVLEEAIARARSPEEEVRLRLAAKSLLFGFDRFRALEFEVRDRAGEG